jgi:hypothetical protein
VAGGRLADARVARERQGSASARCVVFCGEENVIDVGRVAGEEGRVKHQVGVPALRFVERTGAGAASGGKPVVEEEEAEEGFNCD